MQIQLKKFKGWVKILRLDSQTIPANKLADTIKAYEKGGVTYQRLTEEAFHIMHKHHLFDKQNRIILKNKKV